MTVLFRKLQQGFKILKLTRFKYFRASQITDLGATFYVNGKPVFIEGQSVLSMLIEIVLLDSYHLKKLEHPKVIFDIGANVGVFSVHAATLFPECSIYSFEPSLNNFKLLERNTKKFSNIHCVNMAVSNRNGTAYLSGQHDPTAFKITDHTSADVLQQCPTITLQTFMMEHSIQHIDCLKLDCEGAEYGIIGHNISYAKQVVGEYHYLGYGSTADIKSALLKQGFIIKEWTNPLPNGNGIFWGVHTSGACV